MKRYHVKARAFHGVTDRFVGALGFRVKQAHYGTPRKFGTFDTLEEAVNQLEEASGQLEDAEGLDGSVEFPGMYS